MTNPKAGARLIALARETAECWHAGNYSKKHDGTVDTCQEPDCVLVREAAASSSSGYVADLIRRLRERARIECMEMSADADAAAAFDDVPEITFDELRVIAQLFTEAADALSALSGSTAANPAESHTPPPAKE